MKKVILFLFLPLSIFILGACSSGTNDTSRDNEHIMHDTVLGDIREETASRNILPDFLTDKHEMMQQTYMAVAMNQELLEKIPCYCGCGESVGHKSSYECFVHQNNDDGSLIWDDHGTKCNVCVEIAIKSIVDHNNGKSVEDIRNMIDETYKEGYANPTPTPEL